MFALQLPPFGILHLRGTSAARRGGSTPAAGPDAARAAAPVVAVDPVPAAPDLGAARDLVTELDPAGVRVVPLRPASEWPLRRAYDRVANPFRAFPYRSLHLSRMMAPADPRD
jgi:hypothetical protein